MTVAWKTANLLRKSGVERVKGIEPSSQAWEAHILPLNHTRVWKDQPQKFSHRTVGKQRRSCGAIPIPRSLADGRVRSQSLMRTILDAKEEQGAGLPRRSDPSGRILAFGSN